MRKLLASLAVLGALAPVAIAVANETTPTASVPSAELTTERAIREARGELRRKARAAQRREAARERRAERRAERAAAPPVEGGPSQATLDSIAACESGGDPAAIGGGGTFRGKYQFMQATWEAVGGSGDPAAASEAEQDRRAAMLYAQSGPGQWPVCGA